jgi:ubiquinone/menaquinone biosynthesis C-methylase UbiE
MKDISSTLPWQEIIEWDIENWSYAPKFWLANTSLDLPKRLALDLGSRGGGLSLFLALNGLQVVCSDLNEPGDNAKKLHQKHNVSSLVSYAAVNATSIPYPDLYFDVVVFKSVLGALQTYLNQTKMMQEIYRVLKPGGELWFAENLVASPLHMLTRKLFIGWSKRWRYLTKKEIIELCRPFRQLNCVFYGFLAAFGRNEPQRKLLGKIDKALDRVIPSNWKYIIFGLAQK